MKTGEDRKTYNIRCPVCGAINRGLNLEETDGRYICCSCGRETVWQKYKEGKEADNECNGGEQSRQGDAVITAGK